FRIGTCILKFAGGFGMKIGIFDRQTTHCSTADTRQNDDSPSRESQTGKAAARAHCRVTKSSGDRSIVRAAVGPDYMPSDPFVPLSDLERDALAELSNI